MAYCQKMGSHRSLFTTVPLKRENAAKESQDKDLNDESRNDEDDTFYTLASLSRCSSARTLRLTKSIYFSPQ